MPSCGWSAGWSTTPEPCCSSPTTASSSIASSTAWSTSSTAGRGLPRQLLGIRGTARRGACRAIRPVHPPAATDPAHGGVRRAIPCPGHQGPPGAKPPEGPGAHAAHRPGPRGLALRVPFRQPEKLPRPLLALENQAAGYGGRVLLERVTLTLAPGDRVALLGRNGAGKFTHGSCWPASWPPCPVPASRRATSRWATSRSTSSNSCCRRTRRWRT